MNVFHPPDWWVGRVVPEAAVREALEGTWWARFG